MTTSIATVDAALALAAREWAVFPVQSIAARGCTCGRPACDSPGKHPLTEHGLKDATTDPVAIEAWWERWPYANVAVATGAISGLVVLDVDGEMGELSLAELVGVHRALPPTVQSITGHGRHHLFAHPGETIRNQASSRLGPGLDVRSDGGYIVAPPSSHASGATYQWADGATEVLVLPPWLLELLREPPAPAQRPASPVVPLRPLAAGGTAYGLAALAREAAAVRGAGQGQRNNRLNRAAFALGQLVAGGELEDAVVRAELEAAAVDVGLGEREIANTIGSGLVAGGADPRRAPAPPERAKERPKRHLAPVATDDGDPGPTEPPVEPPDGPGPDLEPGTPDQPTDLRNARRLVAAHGPDLRYCADRGQWLAWDGHIWAADPAEVHRRMKAVVGELYLETVRVPPDQRKKWLRDVLACESQARLSATVRCAETEPGITIAAKELDADPWLLCVQNGTINLRTGELREHRREDLITRMAPVTYDTEAPTPVFDAFVERIFGGDAELIAFVQRAVGYSMTGTVGEHVLLFLHGSGANGKSTFLELLLAMLGDYAIKTEGDLLLARRGEVHPTGVADLAGARLAITEEVEQGRRFDEGLVKRLTGGDRVKARFMRMDFFTFVPTHTLWIAANHLPVVRGTDHAIWRRIRLVPFEVVIPEEERDLQLGAKLAAEGPGILAWAVRGCLEWQRDGLGRPPQVAAATEAYRVEMDTLGQFVEDRLEADQRGWITAKELRRLYVSWCEEQGEYVQTPKVVGQMLTERGYRSERRGRAKVHTWVGIIERDPMRPRLSEEPSEEEGSARHTDSGGRTGSIEEMRPHAAPCGPDSAVPLYTRAPTRELRTKGPHGAADSPPRDDDVDPWEEPF